MYSIKKVSDMLGISTSTIRAWENRYQVITPTRTPGGHRLYSDADIEVLKWLQIQLNDNDLKISEAVHLLKQTKALDSEPIPSYESSEHKYANLADELYEHMIQMDSNSAHALIDYTFSLYHFQEVFHHILTPVMKHIGDQWESGSISVAQEHFASELVLQRFHQFLRILPVQTYLPKALALCPEGELHQMGLMLFTLFLRNKGMDVIYLGANTPYSGLMKHIANKQVRLVAISATDPKRVEDLADWIEQCRREFPDIHIVLGGDAFEGGTEIHDEEEREGKHALKSGENIVKVEEDSRLPSPYVLSGQYEHWEEWFDQRYVLRSAQFRL